MILKVNKNPRVAFRNWWAIDLKVNLIRLVNLVVIRPGCPCNGNIHRWWLINKRDFAKNRVSIVDYLILLIGVDG